MNSKLPVFQLLFASLFLGLRYLLSDVICSSNFSLGLSGACFIVFIDIQNFLSRKVKIKKTGFMLKIHLMKEYIFMSRFVIEKSFSFCVHSCTAGRRLNV